MFSMLRKSLSGDSNASNASHEESAGLNSNTVDEITPLATPSSSTAKKGKRHRSGDNKNVSPGSSSTNSRNKSKVSKQQCLESTPSEFDSSDSEITKESQTSSELPEETPVWGLKLLEVLQRQFMVMNKRVGVIENKEKENCKSIKKLEKKLANVESKNNVLRNENSQLKEHLLDMEFYQKRNNLIFEGIYDTQGESDLDCIAKL